MGNTRNLAKKFNIKALQELSKISSFDVNYYNPHFFRCLGYQAEMYKNGIRAVKTLVTLSNFSPNDEHRYNMLKPMSSSAYGSQEYRDYLHRLHEFINTALPNNFL